MNIMSIIGWSILDCIIFKFKRSNLNVSNVYALFFSLTEADKHARLRQEALRKCRRFDGLETLVLWIRYLNCFIIAFLLSFIRQK